MGNAVKPRTLRVYVTEEGKVPFAEWMNKMPDKDRRRVQARLDRLAEGNLGDCKSVGNGVHELRLFFGAGCRVYFAFEGNAVVLLLCGGTKDTQNKDIKRAKEYWNNYQER